MGHFVGMDKLLIIMLYKSVTGNGLESEKNNLVQSNLSAPHNPNLPTKDWRCWKSEEKET